jgi:hypothetical protein
LNVVNVIFVFAKNKNLFKSVTGGGVFFRASNRLGIFNSYLMYSTSCITSMLAAPDLPTFIVIGLFKANFANWAILGARLEEKRQVCL